MSGAADPLFLDEPPRHPSGAAMIAVQSLLIAIAYAATGYAGLRLSFIGGSVTLFWPPSGIAFAALWMGGNRFLPAIVAGAVAVNLATGLPLPLAGLVAVGNTLAAWTAVALLRRLLRERPSAGELTRIFWFILVPVLACALLSATIGTVAVGVLHPLGSSVQSTWLVWWMGDAMGVLIVAPPILLWRRTVAGRVRWRDVLDAGAFVAGAAIIIAGLRFIHEPIWAVELCKLFTLLLSLWAGARFGLNGPAAMTVLMAAGAIGVTVDGTGPFARGSFYDSFALVHSYLFAEAVAGMLLAAAIADLRRALQGERAALRAVAAASDSRIRLLTMISHDVRTPLSGITGVLQTLQRSTLTPQQDHLVGLGVRAGDTITALVTDILDVARLDGGAVKLNPQSFDPACSVNDVVEISRAAAAAKGLEIHVDLDPSLPACVVGDRVRFEQLVGNLVTNAVAYTNVGRVAVSAIWNETLTVRIADTGPGIAPEVEPHIFDAFVRGSTGRTGGLGLGLQICRQLATLMGGTITFRPGSDGGSCFAVSVPLLGCAPPVPVVDGPVVDDRPLAIMLVEDDEIAREATAALLASHGHDVVAIDDAAVMALLSQRTFDLILLDIRRSDGDMSGLDIITSIRALTTPARETTVVALTGDGLIDNHRTYVAAGMDGVLVKPLSLARGVPALMAEARAAARGIVAV